MKKLIWPIAFVLAFAVPTYAQQQDKIYTLQVNNDELTKIGSALGKLSYDDAAPLIAKLRQQIVDQNKPVEASKPVDPKPADPPKSD